MIRFTAPTTEQVAAALFKLPTPQLRRAFYDGLENPLWVKPLLKAGAFSCPPEPEEVGNGHLRNRYWPEIGYLIRMAPAVPGDVVDVLVTLENTSNASVRRAVFEIGGQIPTEQGVRLIPLLKVWGRTDFGWWSDPRDMVSFAVRLLGGDQKSRDAGRWIANLLFGAREVGDDGRTWVRAEFGLSSFWYLEELPRIVDALGVDALKALKGWLLEYIRFAGLLDEDHDSSGCIRPLIRDRDDSVLDPSERLVEVICDLALPAMVERPYETAEVLLVPSIHLLCKIALHVVSEAIQLSIESGADTTALENVGKRLLLEDAADDEYSRFEYAELAKAVAKVNPGAVEVVETFLASAYARDLEWMRDKLVNRETGKKATEEEIQDAAIGTRHLWLATIGKDALPSPLRNELQQLDSSRGEFEELGSPPGFLFSWSGPNAELAVEELAELEPDALVTRLANLSFEPEVRGPEPTHEGQARAFSDLIKANPFAVAGIENLSTKLRPIYVRAIIQGWDEALRAGEALDWQQAADLIAEVLSHSDDSDVLPEGAEFDDDHTFRNAKNSAVGLLGELLKRRADSPIPPNVRDQLAQSLIEEADDERAWHEYDAAQSDGGFDPLTMSLNWQWPKRLRALIELATDPAAVRWQEAALRVLTVELARPDKHGAASAVVGEGLAKLYNHARGWLDTQVSSLFGSAEGLSERQQVALTTAISVHHYHSALYDLLREPLLGAIAVGDDLVSGWRGQRSKPIEQIGEWIIDARIWGHQDRSDPLADAFFATTSPKSRGESMGSIAWSFFRATKVDDDIRKEFEALWDERLCHVRQHLDDAEELSGIYWCAKGDKFSSEWWLPRLVEALQLAPDIATEGFMIGRELSAASANQPRLAFNAMKLLLDKRHEEDTISFNLVRYGVAMVIANAIAAHDGELAQDAEDFLNQLGSRGNLGLEEEVKAVLGGSITQDDVEGA